MNVDKVNVVDQDHYTIAELLAREGCDPILEGVEGMNDYLEGQVYSDSESEEVLEHLSKDNLVASDLDIISEKKLNGKDIKIKCSSRVVRKLSHMKTSYLF